MFFVYGICLCWLLLCGRIWWTMGAKHSFQRRLVAVGAGLSAGLLFYTGAMIVKALEARSAANETQAPRSESVRIHPKKE